MAVFQEQPLASDVQCVADFYSRKGFYAFNTQCRTSGISRHVETYFQHFTHFKHHFPRGTLPS